MLGDKVVATVTGNSNDIFKIFINDPKREFIRTQNIAPSGSIFNKFSRGQSVRYR